jgi:hypothetical protein
MVLLGAGICLALSAIVFIVLMARKQPAATTYADGASAGDYGDFDGESAYMPAADDWDDDEQGGWGDEGYDDDSPSAYGPAQGGRSGGAAPNRSSSRAPTRGGGLLSRKNDDDSPSGSRFRR